MNKIAQLNDFVATRLTLLVGTMMCFYIFLLWSLLPLLFPSTQNVVFYSSSAVLQLTLLPLIMVGQSILNRKTELRAEQDHKAVVEILADIQELVVDGKTIQAEQSEEIADLNKFDARMTEIEKLLQSVPVVAPVISQ
jgi:ABC-type multidrug transport system fused ATPase/permease subunit